MRRNTPIPVTRLDADKNVIKHYPTLQAAGKDIKSCATTIKYYMETQQMDNHREYWVKTVNVKSVLMIFK